ncbi:MAG: DEAD/DEAH box helicase family protein [Deltaproteobacteria bacterium]|nr:DEAD/DEAH box helicase family protein [Deltaproteobacteria bacterium]
MAKRKAERNRLKRKEKQKRKRVKLAQVNRGEKLDWLISEYEWLMYSGMYDKALVYLTKALKVVPNDLSLWQNLGYLGQQLNRPEIEFQALNGLYTAGALEDRFRPIYSRLLMDMRQYERALALATETLNQWPEMKIPQRRLAKDLLKRICAEARACIGAGEVITETVARRKSAGLPADTSKAGARKGDGAAVSDSAGQPLPERPLSISLPRIPLTVAFDGEALAAAWEKGEKVTQDQYDLTMSAYRIRLNETFDHLVCLNLLQGVRSFWYQEETAKKVLKRFRGRALLADEVGLGKTIEALMVFSEYYRRGMIKNGLILTPTPLVSQWKEELQSKFGLEVSSTDDADYRSKGERFWREPFILASINQAKSRKNFPLVTERAYDIVIVDEAHHLKNRNTLNWKLVNSLKKKYLLMLTATPVENNLMELYNLITLLKPGQLKTASVFRDEFMTRGDPTDPRNRDRLKSLLGEVMIRNTRALAKIDIPPRFAQTIRVEATRSEKTLYERISRLVIRMHGENGGRGKMLLKTLLVEAGSSPRAVGLTLTKMLEGKKLRNGLEDDVRGIRNLCRTMDRTRKNETLLKLLKKNPGKVIVFVKYLGTLEHLSEFLARERIPHAMFHGGMGNQKKDAQIHAFRKEKDILITTEIGGEGRNLQFCHQMVNYDLPWNPMKIEQRIGRIHRIGQKKEVMIFNLCGAGSVEESILDILDKKINMFEMVIGEVDMILGRMREEQDFSDMVYDIWVNAASEADRSQAFKQLATRLKRSKTSYEKSKQLDEALFGENYEL